jgi:hypothetical protein
MLDVLRKAMILLIVCSPVWAANKVVKPVKKVAPKAVSTVQADPKMTVEEFLLNPIVRDQIQDEALGLSDDAQYEVKCVAAKDICELNVQDGEKVFHFTVKPSKDFEFDAMHRIFGLFLHKPGNPKPDFIEAQYNDEASAIIDAEYKFPTEEGKQ